MKRFLIGVGIVVLLSCGEEKSVPFQKKSVLRIPLYQDIQGIDPIISTDIMTSNIARQVFDGLFDYDPKTFDVVPEIVSKYEVSGDTLTLHLRKDVYFHRDACFIGEKKRKVCAEDVVYSLRRKVKYEQEIGGTELSRFISENSIETSDSFTLKIIFKGDLKGLIYVLASQGGWIIPEEAVEFYGEKFQYHPVGCGPFRLSLYDPPRVLILTRNEDYYKKDEKGEKLPLLDEIDFLFLTGEAKEASFRRGKVDISFVSFPLNRESDTAIKVFMIPRLNTLGLGFNMAQYNLFTRNKKLREAIALAVPPDTSVGYRAKSFLPQLKDWPIKLKPIPYDPERAVKLLREGGIKRGEELEFYIPVGDERIYGQRVKEFLEKVGLRVKVISLPRHIYWQKVEKGELPFFRIGWISDNPDVSHYYSVFTSESGSNLTHYKNPEYDSLFLLLKKAQKHEEKLKYMYALESILRRDLPFIYWKHEIIRVTIRSYVKGFEASLNPFNRWYLEYVYLEK